jgi:prevent-host-death family protein
MQITVSDAKARLTDLVRRVEAGEEVVLTRHGHPVAQLVAAHKRVSTDGNRRLNADRPLTAFFPGSPSRRIRKRLRQLDEKLRALVAIKSSRLSKFVEICRGTHRGTVPRSTILLQDRWIGRRSRHCLLFAAAAGDMQRDHDDAGEGRCDLYEQRPRHGVLREEDEQTDRDRREAR